MAPRISVDPAEAGPSAEAAEVVEEPELAQRLSILSGQDGSPELGGEAGSQRTCK